MLNTAEDTATLVCVLMARSKATRARLSVATIKKLSRRERLKAAFILSLQQALADRGYFLAELDSGGYGVMPCKALEAAKAITAKAHLTEEERRALRRGELDFAPLAAELAGDEEDDDEHDAE